MRALAEKSILKFEEFLTHFRLVVKNVYQLRHVHPSLRLPVCPHVLVRLPLDGFQ